MARVLAAALPWVEDPLTPSERVGLLPLDEALRGAHFPTEPAAVADALERLAFDELLALQLSLARSRAARAHCAPRLPRFPPRPWPGSSAACRSR